jgi:hypothetical protein
VLAVVAALMAVALIVHFRADDSGSTTTAPPSGAMLHPREGAMYHQPYTSTR